MAFFENTRFNAAEVEPSAGFEPLPEGEYMLMIKKAEEKQTKSGNGLQLVLTLAVVDGKHKGRSLFARINLENPSAQCVAIGRAELSAFCRAVGIIQPKGVYEFANRTVRAKIKVAERADGKGLTNEIASWIFEDQVVAAAPRPVGAAAGPAPWATR